MGYANRSDDNSAQNRMRPNLKISELHKILSRIDTEALQKLEKEAVAAAFELGIFERVAEAGIDAQTLSTRMGLNLELFRAVERLLCCGGYFRTRGGKLHLSAYSMAVFSRRSPLFRPSVLAQVDGEKVRILKALLTEETPFGAPPDWSNLNREGAQSLAKNRFAFMNIPSFIYCSQRPFMGIRTLADLSGAGGAWARNALVAHPGLRFTVCGPSLVVEGTRSVLKMSGCPEDRLEYFIGGIPSKAHPEREGYLISNYLHNWPASECMKMMRLLAQRISDDAHVWIDEALLDENGFGPPFTAAWNLAKKMNHGGQQFTFRELRAILEEAGFAKPRIVANAAHYSLLLTRKKMRAR